MTFRLSGMSKHSTLSPSISLCWRNRNMASIHISFQVFPAWFPQQHYHLTVCLKLQKIIIHSSLASVLPRRSADVELASMIQVVLSLILTQVAVFSPLTLRWSHFENIWSFLFKLFPNLVHSPLLITHSCSYFIFLSTKPAPPLICLHIPPRNLIHSPLDLWWSGWRR